MNLNVDNPVEKHMEILSTDCGYRKGRLFQCILWITSPLVMNILPTDDPLITPALFRLIHISTRPTTTTAISLKRLQVI